MKRLSVFAAGLLVLAVIGVNLNAMDKLVVDQRHAPDKPGLAIATFAGGCFWCVEAGFERVPGVVEVVSGYSGGVEGNPSYQQVASGATGHTESVQVYYDPNEISYEGLLQALWRMMDPTDTEGQFVDRGKQYRPAIFYADETQRDIAETSKKALEESGRYENAVAIEIVPLGPFHAAEDYHQDYYKTNPVRYKFYTFNSGRYQFIDKVWGDDRKLDYAMYRPVSHEDQRMNQSKSVNEQTNLQNFVKPDKATLKASLTPLQYSVTQNDATERPFDNPYNSEKRAGIYVDIVSGEPLYLSNDKYESGTGWPSFIRPIKPDAVVEKSDFSLFGKRTEIRSATADSHLGHVFTDGPKESTGLRYCMNSAAMRFIPKEDMAAAGYEAYVDQVKPPQN